jgi:hypothetical protein
MAGEVEAGLAIANLLISAAGSLPDASDKALGLEEIELQREAAQANRDLLQKYMTEYYPNIAEQQRSELDKAYQDVYKNLTGAWGQQASGFSAMDQEAGAGTSAQAIMDVTKGELAYNFGDDLTMDMNGGLYAISKSNLENEIQITLDQMQSALDIYDRSIGYYNLAEEELNKSSYQKGKEDFQAGWDDIWRGVGEFFTGSGQDHSRAPGAGGMSGGGVGGR